MLKELEKMLFEGVRVEFIDAGKSHPSFPMTIYCRLYDPDTKVWGHGSNTSLKVAIDNAVYDLDYNRTIKKIELMEMHLSFPLQL